MDYFEKKLLWCGLKQAFLWSLALGFGPLVAWYEPTILLVLIAWVLDALAMNQAVNRLVGEHICEQRKAQLDAAHVREFLPR